ncbi:hypothetical protein GEOBRER4_n2093 [Citrifermentans bremense]|uniref:Uncharacterized protein n=1 Tax=Citrifermentans bremense TaxID=60035 RepID=A0A6S6M770_9BACT|nr:hypothetical protein [Citrifermentans bremense]BCG47265.1 hypothetical protein GEOBRER4_n2093 [Citrifermentans bremense]
MKKQIAAATIIAAAMLAGCGGGGGSATPTSATVAGKVADGYLVNATVFMDKNNNYLWDEGEPKTTTDANGAYTLTVDPADVGQFPIIALAIAGTTIDKDTNSAVLHSYLLSLPKESVTGTVSTDSNFLSPMSTQLREMMETGNYATMYDAMVDLRTKLGLDSNADLMADYIASHNSTMHTTAQNMATMMGQQQNLMFRNYSGANHLDVTRYRNMMGAMFSNMSTVRTNTQTSSQMTDMSNAMYNNLNNIAAGLPYQNMGSFNSGMTWGNSMMGGR